MLTLPTSAIDPGLGQQSSEPRAAKAGPFLNRSGGKGTCVPLA